MTRRQPTTTIVEQADVVGWWLEHFSSHTKEWTEVALLRPEFSEEMLRARFGEIRNVSELIVLDTVPEEFRSVCDQVESIGWQFETHSDQTDEWPELVTFDTELTHEQLHARYGKIRNITPVSRLTDVAKAIHEADATELAEPTEASTGDRDAR